MENAIILPAGPDTSVDGAALATVCAFCGDAVRAGRPVRVADYTCAVRGTRPVAHPACWKAVYA